MKDFRNKLFSIKLTPRRLYIVIFTTLKLFTYRLSFWRSTMTIEYLLFFVKRSWISHCAKWFSTDALRMRNRSCASLLKYRTKIYDLMLYANLITVNCIEKFFCFGLLRNFVFKNGIHRCRKKVSCEIFFCFF